MTQALTLVYRKFCGTRGNGCSVVAVYFDAARRMLVAHQNADQSGCVAKFAKVWKRCTVWLLPSL